MISNPVLFLIAGLSLSLSKDDGPRGEKKGNVFPSINVPDRSKATWYGSEQDYFNVKAWKHYSTSSMRSPALSTWYGADHWSSSGKNRHSVPGRRPGDVLYLAAGEYENFRVTRSWDVFTKGVKKNPTRWVSDDRTYTYLWDDGTIRLGLNNRDQLKGIWAEDGSDYFRWGSNPQTWIVGEVGRDGYPKTEITGGRTYLEWAGAVSFANLVFKGPTSAGGSEGILQTENPFVHDSRGNKLRQQPNWPEPGSVYGEWQGFRDLEFSNCHIDGEWDFVKDRGEPNKWGFLTYRVGRSSRGPNVAGFRWHGGSVKGIKAEHCHYHHNIQAMSPKHMAVHYRDVEFGPSGRTALQFVARESEGPDGLGRILIEHCTIRNVCLEQGGGGSALTFSGNHNGKVTIRKVDCWLGDGSIPTDNVTGGFVSHAGKGSGGRPTRSITIENSIFRVGPLTGRDAARRPNLQIGNVKNFTIRNTKVYQASGAREAIAVQDEVGTLTIGNNDIRGDVLFGSQIWRDVDSDGDGWDDGEAWHAFMVECSEHIDTNNDGVIAPTSGVVSELILE